MYERIIDSPTNPFVKWVASLSDKKGRNREKRFIVEGVKLTIEAIKSKLPITHIVVSEDKKEIILDAINPEILSLKDENFEFCILSQRAFEKVSTEKSPQGVICVIKYLDFFSNIDIIYKEDFFIRKEEKVLSLFSVRDPLNLGAIIRSAVAFGVDHIVISDDCADIYNPKTMRSAMGGIFKVKISTISSFDTFVVTARELGRRVFAAELRDGAVPLNAIEMLPTDIVIIGNEGHGISSEVSNLCDKSIFIPIAENTESLNASVAASIFMWEQSRKQ